MQRYDGQYSGAAIQGFVVGLGQPDQVIRRVLQPRGLTSIDPHSWYDLELVRSIYYDLERMIGSNTLYNAGVHLVENAALPPQITTVAAMFASLDAAYRANARGPAVGGVAASFDLKEPESATLVFSTPFPCHLEQGIVAGCCRRFKVNPLLEHGAEGCRDRGDAVCTYHVSW